MTRDRETTAKTFAVGQLDQAIVRLTIVGAVVLISIMMTFRLGLGFNPPPAFLVVVTGYFVVSLGFLGWAYHNLRHPPSERILRFKRLTYPVLDIGVNTALMVLMGPQGGLLLPVYLSVTMGNGMRAGKDALFLSQVLSVSGFTLVVAMVPFWRQNPALTAGVFIGLALIPLYVLSLINRLNRTLADLEHTNEARSRFIANMSHELRTPLHAIISTADVLKERRSTDREDLELLRMVSSSADHLLTMVNQVLDVARLDSGNMPTSDEEFELHEQLRRVRDIIAPTASSKGLDFRFSVDADLPSRVLGPRESLTQVLVNLCGNAVKFTAAGQVSLSVSRVHDAADTPHAAVLMIEVDDTGIGMSEEAIGNIFKPFTQAEDDISRSFGGTGLGLTIAYELTKLAGGDIRCRSVPGVGTHFEVVFPLTPLAVDATTATRAPVDLLVISDRTLEADERGAIVAAGFSPFVVDRKGAVRHARALAAQPDLPVVVDLDSYAGDAVTIAAGLASELSQPVRLIAWSRRLGTLRGDGSPSHGPFEVRFSNEMAQCWRALRDTYEMLLRDRDVATTADTASGRRLRVLVADDNHANRRTARMALAAAGHDVTLVADGEEALDALERDDFDVALMDMHMPNMDGLEAAKLYRHIAPDDATPIVMLTADVTDDARAAARRAGVVGFVLKPAGARDLRAAVQRYARPPVRSAAAPVEAVAERPALARNPQSDAATTTPGGTGTAATPVPAAEAAAGERIVALTDALVDPKEIRELIECGSTPAELSELVAEFATDAQRQIDLIASLHADSRYGEAREVMHSLKGSAGVIGATGVFHRMTRLERMTLSALAAQGARELAELRGIVEHTEHALIALLDGSADGASASGPERNSAR